MATIGFTSVAPRVVDENHGGSLPLVDRIQALLQVERPSIVGLLGDGKSTALRFVAEYFADDIASGRLPLAITRGRANSRMAQGLQSRAAMERQSGGR